MRLDTPDDRGRPSDSLPARREFEFSGTMYAAVHLPTALLSAHAKPGMAVVGEDLNDLEAKSKVFLHELTSPAIKDAVKKNAAALYTLTKIEVKVGAILFAIAVAKEKGIAALGALGVAKEVFGAGSGFLSLPDDIKTFVRQFEQAMPSIGMASPDLYRAMSAGLDAMAAGAKLAVDVKKLGGV